MVLSRQPFLSLLFVFSVSLASSALVNHTIDDTVADGSITYDPPTGWQQGPNCDSCSADASLIDASQTMNLDENDEEKNSSTQCRFRGLWAVTSTRHGRVWVEVEHGGCASAKGVWCPQ